MEILCVLRKQDFDVTSTKTDGDRFSVKEPVGFALERYFIERRENLKEIFKRGEHQDPKKKLERSGFFQMKL